MVTLLVRNSQISYARHPDRDRVTQCGCTNLLCILTSVSIHCYVLFFLVLFPPVVWCQLNCIPLCGTSEGQTFLARKCMHAWDFLFFASLLFLQIFASLLFLQIFASTFTTPTSLVCIIYGFFDSTSRVLMAKGLDPVCLGNEALSLRSRCEIKSHYSLIGCHFNNTSGK